MNRLRCPLAQICQRARTKPSQPTNAITADTTGRFSPRHGDGVRCRTELSSSDVEVSCKASTIAVVAGRAKIWPGRAAYQSDATLPCGNHPPSGDRIGRDGCRAEKRNAGEIRRAFPP